MEGLSFSKTARRTFHDVPYVLTIAGDNESLSVDVEHTEDGRKWQSKFAARFVEDITQRTGNSKTFEAFVRMMLSALAQESDSVHLDVLTGRDLEMLRRHANPQGPPSTSTVGRPDKRYLILTYRAEFDKVHYPLPLPPVERSEEEALRAVVSRLQAENAEARRTIATLEERALAAARRVDGDGHEATVKNAEATAALHSKIAELSDALRVARRESEQLRAEAKRQPAVEAGGSAASAEVKRLKAECARQQTEIQALRKEATQRERASKREVERFEKQIRKLEEDRRTLEARAQSARRTPSVDRGRPPSVDRSRPAARTPSAERGRPPSRASSVASSRASSCARERTPSPSSFLARRSGSGSGERPWVYRQQRGNSPGAARQAEKSPALQPYRQKIEAMGSRGRTPSPQGRARDRTPSPGQSSRTAAAGSAGVAPPGGARPPLSLRAPASAHIGSVASPAPGRVAKPTSGRYGPPPRAASQDAAHGLRGVHDAGCSAVAAARGRDATPDREVASRRPGDIFGLAADLGLRPSAGAGVGAGYAGPGAAKAADAAEACDIDARLQALQSFLKQTKNISG